MLPGARGNAGIRIVPFREEESKPDSPQPSSIEDDDDDVEDDKDCNRWYCNICKVRGCYNIDAIGNQRLCCLVRRRIALLRSMPTSVSFGLFEFN